MKRLFLLPLVLLPGGCSHAPSAPHTFYIGQGNDGINELAMSRLSQEVSRDAQSRKFVIQWGLVSKMSRTSEEHEMTYDRTAHTLSTGVYRLTNVTDQGIHMVAAKHGDIRGLWMYGRAAFGEIPMA